MKYLWTEDTGAGLHFWKLVNQLFFDNALVVESKESNQGVLYSLTSLNAKEEDLTMCQIIRILEISIAS